MRDRSTVLVGARPAAVASDAQQDCRGPASWEWLAAFPRALGVIMRAGATPPWRRRKRKVDPQLLSAASHQLEAQDLARRQAAATAGHMGERQRMR